MGKTTGIVAALAAFGLLTTVPVGAQSASQAEKLRQLDIMLMVTGLRCRHTSDNFQPDYQRFTTKHIATLNAASDQLKARYAQHGPAHASRALDKLSVTMANTYGQGHPWLSCRDLKVVARSLAQADGAAVLVEAADQLLASKGTARFAWVR